MSNANYKLTRWMFVTLVALIAGLSLSAWSHQDTTPARKPNIIVMLADDLGYGDLGSYGCEDIKTPNIDMLAKEGVRFTDAYASAPVCSPTRVAFVTGRYQQRYGDTFEDYMGAGAPGIDPVHKTIGTYMKQAGYRTVCYGKWNVGGRDFFTPMDHGFDEWVGMDHNHNYFSHLGYDHSTGKWNGQLRMWQGRENKDIPGYTTDVFGDLAVNYIKNQVGDKPFFMYLPWQAPHSPLQAPDAKYASDEEIAGAPKATKPSMRGDYIKIVERLDYQVGRIMQTLKEKGLDDNTLVVFTSDNGGHRAARNLPLKGFKQDLDEGGIRVPMLMRWPGKLPEAKVTSQMAITFDVTATVAALGGAKISPQAPLDGIDLIKAIQTDGAGEERTLYWRRRTVNTHAKVNKVRAKAIRQGDWKYIKDNAHGTEGLYNLHDDMAEQNNLLGTQNPKANKLIELLEQWEKDVSSFQ